MKDKPKPQVKKVVLAYSGGLDTSVIVPWLKENYGCEVVCFCANVGQGDEDLRGLEQKAIKSGASQCIIHDMKEEFASEYLFPMLKAGAVYEHKYLLGTSGAQRNRWRSSKGGTVITSASSASSARIRLARFAASASIRRSRSRLNSAAP